MQVSGETLAKVVKSAVGMCRLVVKQTQKLLKVLSVLLGIVSRRTDDKKFLRIVSRIYDSTKMLTRRHSCVYENTISAPITRIRKC